MPHKPYGYELPITVKQRFLQYLYAQEEDCIYYIIRTLCDQNNPAEQWAVSLHQVMENTGLQRQEVVDALNQLTKVNILRHFTHLDVEYWAIGFAFEEIDWGHLRYRKKYNHYPETARY